MNPVRRAMLLVTVLALLVALAWVIGYAFFLRNPAESADPIPTATLPAVTTAAITPGLSPVATVAQPSPVVFNGFAVVTSRVLNLRAAPDTSANILGTLKFGDIVQLTRREGGWYRTTEGSWISALFVEVRQTRPEAESYARELTR